MKETSLFSRLRASAAKSPITLVCQVSKHVPGAFVVLALAIIVAGTVSRSASAQAVTFTGSGAVNFGSVNVCPSGKTAPAPCSRTLTLTYNVTESGTLGSPRALTTGQPDLDYKLASGSTCTGSVTKGNTCKVNVAFAPLAPGARNGAVEIVDASGNVLATTYIYGTGTGPALAFSPSTSTLLSSSLNPVGVAVDAIGNNFVANDFSGVKEILAAGGYTTINTLGGGFYETGGVALDGAGNVFVTNSYFVGNLYEGALSEILVVGGYTTVKTLAKGFSDPRGVAVDGSGNVFVADSSNNAVKEVLAAGGYTTINTLGSGFNNPEAVAVDGNGNVFVADTLNYAVKEILAAGGYTTVKTVGSVANSSNAPVGLALDASGNVYVADIASGFVSEILAAGDYTTVNILSNRFSEPNSLAVDGAGNVYVASLDALSELPRTQPPSFAFGSTIVGTTSKPQSTNVQNIGNTNIVGTFLSISPNWEQVAASGSPDCSASFLLVPGSECNLSISFEPTETGSLTGAVTLTDNTLNAPGSSQEIPLSGTGVNTLPPQITSLSTTYGAPYSVVIVNGTYFGATQGSSTVTFNGVATPHYRWSNSQIYVTVPPNATTGKVVVTVGGMTSNSVTFTVEPMPVVTGIAPTSGSIGTFVTISGNNLLDYGDLGSVTFSGQPLQIISQSSTALVVAVPVGAVTGHFHVLVNDTGINTPTFTVSTGTVTGPAPTNFGSANVCPSGNTTSAPCSQRVTLTYNFTASHTLGTPLVLTFGAPNLDYKLASGSTCSGSVTNGNTCTVNVTFAPTAPGQRNGAVEMVDTSGNVLATTYIYGTGIGPLVGYGPTVRSLFTYDYFALQSIAVDGFGNLFFAGGVGGYCSSGPLLEALAVDGSVPPNPVLKYLPTGAPNNYPAALALDGAGDIFVANNNCYGYAPSNITEVLAAGGYTTVRDIGGSYGEIGGVAVDGSGDVFFADFESTATTTTATVKEILSAGGYTITKTLGSGFTFTYPAAIAVDGSGNVFIADPNVRDGSLYGAVEEIPASTGYTTVRTIHVSNSLNQGPDSLAIDPAGDLIVAFRSVSSSTQNFGKFFAIDGVLPANPSAVYFNAGLNSIGDVALDSQGNIFTESYTYISLEDAHAGGVRPNDVSGWYDTTVQELSFSTPPQLTFADTYIGHASSDSPQSVDIVNNGNAGLDVTAFSLPSPDFVQVAGTGTPTDCAASFSLVGGAECNVSISFDPHQAGTLNGAVNLVDNSLNLSGSTQSIPLTGEGLTVPPPQITGLSTPYGAPYSVVHVLGANFGANKGSSTVTFNGIAAPVYHWTATDILVTVPGAIATGNVNIVVTVGVEASNAYPITVYPMPVVTGISPISGPVGTPVVISGKNLIAATGLPTVTFNGQSIPVTKQTVTAIYVTVPEPAVTGSFHVLVNDTGINTPVFTVTTQPEIIVGPSSIDAGSANVCPPGKTVPAPCKQTLTLTYNVAANSTLGGIKVLTTGQPNLDYTLAGSTCTGTVTAGTPCTVKVNFAPIAPGARNGAVEILDGSGTITRTTFLHGTGVGPQIAFGPPVQRSFGKEIYVPYDVAVDASGNVFVADFGDGFYGDNRVKELLAVNGSLPANPVIRDLAGYPDTGAANSIALDGAGNVFYAPYQSGASVEEILAADGYATIRQTGVPLILPVSVAVDGSGNVFVIDNFNSVKEILAAGGYTTTKTLAAGFQFSLAAYLAVDGSGNVFVVDVNAADGAYVGVVDEILADGDYTKVNQIHVNSAEHSYPNGIAVDPGGNLYVSYYDGPVPILQPQPYLSVRNSGKAPAIGKALAVNGVVPPHPDILYYPVAATPYGIALDGQGDVYVGTWAFTYNNPSVLQELEFATAPQFNFAATIVGDTSSDSPQSTQIQNNGNATFDLTSLSVSANWNQVAGSGTPEDCTAASSLAPAAQCNLSISFKPTDVGSITGDATLVDNTLNATGAMQLIPLSGTGVAPTTTTVKAAAPTGAVFKNPLSR